MSLVERGLLPDAVIRHGIRRLLAQRLVEEDKGDPEAQQAHLMRLVETLKESPLAIETEAANQQHYEVPAAFYTKVLGKHLKYSSAYFKPGVTALDDAEAEMLKITCERAQLHNGERILELGCGWGSLSLYMAEHFPDSHITGVSNSHSQRDYIMRQAAARHFTNLEIITCDVNVLHFDNDTRFDRVVSVEMFEHLRNYQQLMQRLEQHWQMNGQHYQKTAECWLQNMDAHRSSILPLFAQTYGADQAFKWWNYWRVFFMSCAELWGYNAGREWLVSHYLFARDAKR
jgi:cyclopropane-fatty-acyl-phospholipid synthase